MNDLGTFILDKATSNVIQVPGVCRDLCQAQFDCVRIEDFGDHPVSSWRYASRTQHSGIRIMLKHKEDVEATISETSSAA